MYKNIIHIDVGGCMSKTKILAATNSENKLKEIREILGKKFNILSLSDIALDVEVVEDKDTYYGNALKKATEVCNLSGMISLADDSGLAVDALDGAPGVYSARYSGGYHDAKANVAKLLKEMKGITDRNAKFISCMVVCYPSGKTVTATGETYGRILEKPDVSNGFAYDPIFYSYDLDKSFGKATVDEKNRVSHRARALEKIIKLL